MIHSPSPFERLSRERRLGIVIVLNIAILGLLWSPILLLIAARASVRTKTRATGVKALRPPDAVAAHNAVYTTRPVARPTAPVSSGVM